MTTRFQPGSVSAGAGLEARLASTLALDEPVSRVKLVSTARAGVLADKFGIQTVRDLLIHFPRRYVDMSSVVTVAQGEIGSSCTISGKVHAVKLKRPKRIPLVEITLVDGTGTLMLTMFRQTWLMDKIKPGQTIAVAGKLEFNFGFKSMVNPYLEVLTDEAQASGVIIPVHPATEKLTAALIRRFVGNALDFSRGMIDPIPFDLRLKYRLMSRHAAIACMHFPQSMSEQAQARRRMAYEEVFLLQVALMSRGLARSSGKRACSHVVDGPCSAALEQAIPFSLTDEQTAAKSEILQRMAAERAMNHMLLGDVGTGKTVVAAFALAAVADSGTQAALMAPTEILARQHALSLGPLFDQAGISWALLTGSTKPDERERVLEDVGCGKVSVLIGTHALLEDSVQFENLTLAVIDEQQRFGVDQRAALLGKGENPDALLLTATPIPRTLALALFGDLSLSYIHHRPNDAANRITKVHPRQLKGEAYEVALQALGRGEQVYVVCPLIGDSSRKGGGSSAAEGAGIANGTPSRSAGHAHDEDVYEYASISIEAEADMQGENIAAAEAHARFLQQKTFIDYKVELLHGKLPSAEKQAVMNRFAAGETQVLVATTVIEVGINVPNATVMIIEDADRFGLAQLHQLRGRVGRGSKQGQVHLISGSKSDAAIARLRVMESTDDGFELSSYDLSLRREGDILGNRQSGASVLRLVNVVRDGKIIEAAHDDALRIFEEDPGLATDEHKVLAREARMVFRGATSTEGESAAL